MVGITSIATNILIGNTNIFSKYYVISKITCMFLILETIIIKLNKK